MIVKNCKWCGKEFRARKWKNRPGIFCCRECSDKGRKKREIKTITFKCEYCGKDATHRRSWKCPHRFCSVQCAAKWRGENYRGEKSPRWKGGLGSRTIEERIVVKRVKERQKECERCGSKEDLHGHHKIPVTERPDLRAIEENIEILCCECHANEHPEFLGMMTQKRSGKILKCPVCSKEYYVKASIVSKSKYCSRKCSLTRTSIARLKQGES